MALASLLVYSKWKLWVSLPLPGFFVEIAVLLLCFLPINLSAAVRRLSLPLQLSQKLRFGRTGEFKILKVADMHYADGKTTPCLNVLPSQVHGCSDLNTSAFIQRMIEDEKPNLIVFTDAKDSAKSLNAAFAPAIAAGIPWAAYPGRHLIQGRGYETHSGALVLQKNQSSTSISLTVAITPQFLLSMAMAGLNSLNSCGFNAPLQNFSVYMGPPMAQKSSAPGLVYFRIPLPKFSSFDASNFTGVRQQGIGSASINSGFFTTMVEAGDVKSIFTGHDHLNDFCGQMTGIQLCYAGGFGYHAYGKVGWSRRARVMVASLEKTDEGG
ncbi:hypothetical protein CXB51_019611 [Gossypium anomalum]|uniref:Inactive purple acid phosphatase 29 n=1 Tax=Gossypium anomalum TaxID=47600 RepID=A0A8J5YZU8_9ROSI|nr:hypothetical protein CXB51_019611 [Gossypium anomalum]